MSLWVVTSFNADGNPISLNERQRPLAPGGALTGHTHATGTVLGSLESQVGAWGFHGVLTDQGWERIGTNRWVNRFHGGNLNRTHNMRPVTAIIPARARTVGNTGQTRRGPGTSFATAGTINSGTRVTPTHRINTSGMGLGTAGTWVRIGTRRWLREHRLS